jgi:hypothetical protein
MESISNRITKIVDTPISIESMTPLEIMHVFFFSSNVESSDCYGNKWTENMANFTHKLDPVITQKVKEIFL